MSIFKKLLIRASKKTPHMGFVIEPYSLFLFFKITDIEKAKSLLPERYEMIKATIFEGDKPDYYFGIGNLNTRGSTFWGVRMETYLIARDKQTGLLSWIFFDILSNTIIALLSEGVKGPNCSQALFTTGPGGNIYLDIEENKGTRGLALECSINNGQIRKPDEEAWITGNTSIGHISELITNNDDPFAVIFDPDEVSMAYDIPPADVKISRNSIVPDFAEKQPSKVVCFPFTQHYIADSPGCRTYIKDKEDMIKNYNKMTEIEIEKPFSTKLISRLFFTGITASSILNIIVIIYLLFKI